MLLVGWTDTVGELDRALLNEESDLVPGSIVREESGLRTRKAFPFESCFRSSILRSCGQWAVEFEGEILEGDGKRMAG